MNGKDTSRVTFLIVSLPDIKSVPDFDEGVILEDTNRIVGYFFNVKILWFSKVVVAHIDARIDRF